MKIAVKVHANAIFFLQLVLNMIGVAGAVYTGSAP